MTTQHFPFQKLDAYQLARQLAVGVHEAQIRHAELRDQAQRAAISVFLQLAEGLPDDRQRMRTAYFTRARNSLCEVAAALDLASALDVVDANAAARLAETAARVRAVLIALLR